MYDREYYEEREYDFEDERDHRTGSDIWQNYDDEHMDYDRYASAANQRDRERNGGGKSGGRGKTAAAAAASVPVDEPKKILIDEAYLMKRLDTFLQEESQTTVNTFTESREIIRGSLLNFFDEQERFKKELAKYAQDKPAFERSKENMTPLSEYLRRKRGQHDGKLAEELELEDNARAEERAAIEKYLKMRERRKQAALAKLKREEEERALEQAESERILKQMELMGKSQATDGERETQLEKIQIRLNSAAVHGSETGGGADAAAAAVAAGGSARRRGAASGGAAVDQEDIANQIIGSYIDFENASNRDKLKQQQDFQTRLLSASRERGSSATSQGRPPAMPPVVTTTSGGFLTVPGAVGGVSAAPPTLNKNATNWADVDI